MSYRVPEGDGEVPLGVAKHTAGGASPRVLAARAVPELGLVRDGSIRTSLPVPGRAVLIISQMDPSRAGVWSEVEGTVQAGRPYAADVTVVRRPMTDCLCLLASRQEERGKQS